MHTADWTQAADTFAHILRAAVGPAGPTLRIGYASQTVGSLGRNGKRHPEVAFDIGAPDTIRTCDFYLRRVALYPSELRAHCLQTKVYHCDRGEASG